MPTADGRFKGISVPELPWLKAEAIDPPQRINGFPDKPAEWPPQETGARLDAAGCQLDAEGQLVKDEATAEK